VTETTQSILDRRAGCEGPVRLSHPGKEKTDTTLTEEARNVAIDLPAVLGH
jgi:hypothetical protein